MKQFQIDNLATDLASLLLIREHRTISYQSHMPKLHTDLSPDLRNAQLFQGAIRPQRRDRAEVQDSTDDDLMREFSEMLDKIAARVNQSIREEAVPLDAFFVAPLPVAAPQPDLPRKEETKAHDEKANRDTQEQETGSSDKLESEAQSEHVEPSSQVHSENAEAASGVHDKRSIDKADSNKSLHSEVSEKAEGVERVQSDGAADDETTLPEDQGFTEVATSLATEGAEPEAASPIASTQRGSTEKAGGDETLLEETPVADGEPVEMLEQTSAEARSPASSEHTGRSVEPKSSEKSLGTGILAASALSSQGALVDTAVLGARPVIAEQLTAHLLRQAAESVAVQRIGGGSNAGGTSSQSFLGQGSVMGRASEQTPKSSSPAATQGANYLKAFERVEAVLKEAARAKDGRTISLKLSPDELGTVKVDVSLREGSLHARLAADSQSVNSLLRERAHDLQLVLRRLGLNVERVTVSVQGEPDMTREFHWSDAGSSFLHHEQSSQTEQREGNLRQTGRELHEQLGVPVEGRPAVAEVLDHWIA